MSYQTITHTLKVPDDVMPTRIDVFLSMSIKEWSRNFFQHIIAKKCVKLNDVLVKKPSTSVQANDTVEIAYTPQLITNPTSIDKDAINIIYEHEHFLIVEKPVGWLVHATPRISPKYPTIVDWLCTYFSDIKNVGLIDRPGIVHRLDKDTSGLLVLARSNYGHQVLGHLFAQRKLTKKYLVIVSGHPCPSGSIDLAIARDPVTRIKMHHFAKNTTAFGARNALTHYRVVEYLTDAALVECTIVTGRTHQIRVHFCAIGHPVIGDQVYGKKSNFIDRQALHAHSLSFTFEQQSYEFTSQTPKDIAQLMNILRNP